MHGSAPWQLADDAIRSSAAGYFFVALYFHIVSIVCLLPLLMVLFLCDRACFALLCVYDLLLFCPFGFYLFFICCTVMCFCVFYVGAFIVSMSYCVFCFICVYELYCATCVLVVFVVLCFYMFRCYV